MIPHTVFTSDAWAAFTRHLTEELQAARVRNDTPASPEDTALTRGEIRCLLKLLALPEQAAPVPLMSPPPDLYES